MQRKASKRSHVFVDRAAEHRRYAGYPELIADARRKERLRVMEDFSREELAALQAKLEEWTRTHAGRRDP